MVSANVSRRDLLAGVGTAGMGALLGATGPASASERTRYNVGTASPAAEEATLQAAERVHRVLDWGSGKKTISAWFPEAALQGLRNRRDVRYIEEDGEMHALEQTVPWGIERVGATLAHDEGETGNGADIAIIDTGIDSDHEDLQANLGAGHAVVGCTEDCNCFPFACGNDNDCEKGWDDDNDHGTHCAGTADAVDNDIGVVGVSTEATLHAVKVLACDGSGSFSDVAEGIRLTADQGYDVGSLSLGGSASDAVEDAVQYAYDEGVLLVAAAGNDGECNDCVSYPAAYPECIAVSATDENDDLASFSSTGPEVELAAPGVDVLSTIPVDDYAYFSGTSMATPHVAGAGGQLMANGLSNTEARQQLAETAEDIGLDDNEQGNGLLDVAAALGIDDGDDGGDDENTSPSCSIVNPEDGSTVADTVTVQVDASDEEDDDTTLDVEVSIDGGSWQSAAFNSDSGLYEYDWDTTAEDDGEHTVDARATDNDGATTNADQITVTVDNDDDDGGDGGDTAPTIDQFDVSTRTTGPWQRADVEWAVSDGDGDLSEVETELMEGDSVLDSETSSVSGSSASGEHNLRDRNGNPDSVTLTVRDETGNETTDSQSL